MLALPVLGHQSGHGNYVKMYHFVNKGPNSHELSRSHREQNSAIRRHVKQVLDQQRRRKPKAAVLPVSSTTQQIACEGWSYQESRPTSSHEDREASLHNSFSSGESSNLPTANHREPLSRRLIAPRPPGSGCAHAQTTTKQMKPYLSEAQIQHELIAKLSVPHLDSILDACSVLPISLTSEELTVFQFWLGQSSYISIGSNARPARSHFENVTKALRIRHVQSCMNNEMNLASLMVFVASSWDRSRKIHWSEISGKWMNKALKTMRDHLDADLTPSSELLLGLISLIGAENHRNNAVGVRVHLHAAKQMITCANGRASVDPFPMYLLHTYDTRLACEESTTPILTSPASLEGLTQEMKLAFHKAFIDMEMMGEGFLALKPPHTIPQAMLIIVKELIDNFKVHQGYIQESGNDQDIATWIVVRRVELRYHLLTLEATTPFQQAVRTTLLLWTFLCQSEYSVIAPLRRLVRDLSHLLATDGVEWKSNISTRDATAWMVTTAAIAEWRCEPWLCAEVSKTFRHREDVEDVLADVTSVMKRFLFIEGARVEHLKRLAWSLVKASP